ncbi:hypothetical protein PR202_ga09178 [Eleusine coracana subsp. coracana]|uniref:NAD(P)-binding domain-containing protein n=1 Tax=Eleusine coracana subsp. coracana TaxID=191504 RepID=A0AAV5C201_ELECO|nr:hypothetical protein PR202_ga09178 [Eleusine coracana subsp. coracana]
MATDGSNDGAARGGLVCVTGGSGFIGSWLVRLLLHRGYTVHATVKNLQDEGETKHLQALDGADTRLRLFQMDLLDAASVQPAINGARGVFHLASPVILQPDRDPEAPILFLNQFSSISSFNIEVVEPAWKGALNDLRAAKDCGVSRVVMVSSQTAMVPNPNWPADKVRDEESWADVELIKKHEEDKQDWLVRAKDPSKKLINLGVRFTPFEKTIRDTMDCFKSKGLI